MPKWYSHTCRKCGNAWDDTDPVSTCDACKNPNAMWFVAINDQAKRISQIREAMTPNVGSVANMSALRLINDMDFPRIEAALTAFPDVVSLLEKAQASLQVAKCDTATGEQTRRDRFVAINEQARRISQIRETMAHNMGSVANMGALKLINDMDFPKIEAALTALPDVVSLLEKALASLQVAKCDTATGEQTRRDIIISANAALDHIYDL